MAKVSLSRRAEQELIAMSPSDRQEVARALSLVENDLFRGQNKIDLVLVEEDERVFAIVVGIIFVAFYEDSNGSVNVVQLSVRSLFRRY